MAQVENPRHKRLSRPSPELRIQMAEAQQRALGEVEKLKLPGFSGLVVTRDREGLPYVRLSIVNGIGENLPSSLGGLPVKIQAIVKPISE